MTTKQKLRLGIFVLLTALGIVLVALGIQYPSSLLFAGLLVAGAALIGTGVPLTIAHVLGSDVDELKDYLLGDCHLGSPPSEAATCAGKWYVYHTTAKDGRRVWQHYLMRLELNSVLGTLQGSLLTLDKNKARQKYNVEAGVRGDRLVIIGPPDKGNEPPFIQVVKGATFEHLVVRCGVDFHQTWDGNSSISACLLSRSPLVDVSLVDTLCPDSEKQLDEIWKRESHGQGIGTLITSIQQLGRACSGPADGSRPAHP